MRARAGSVLTEVGDIVAFGGQVLWSAVRYPAGYWGTVRDQLFEAIKRCIIPMILASTAFGIGTVGIQAGNLLAMLGIPERLGSLMVVGSVREFGPWVASMIVAGVVGTAMIADLGARRIREEIDAMRVLGLNPVRELIVPRVVAVTIVAALMNMVSLGFGTIGGFLGAVPIHGADTAAFLNLFFANATPTEIAATVIKTTCFGVLIGVICAYKGYHAAGGAVGVGRAVNQGVVIAFAAIWIFNAVFTTILLGLNPELQVFK